MTLTKSLLLGSAATLVAVAGAQAADLPSKKAAPATYVKVCDAYGAGFFYIPGTDTCVKLGGYTRYELQYTPAQAIRSPLTGAVTQAKGNQDTWGTEYRGRIDVDARTASAYGTVRTLVSLRGTGTTGLRKTAYSYTGGTASPVLSSTNADLTMERAMVQFAGFTFGIGTSNYAMMPSITYTGNAWAGFPNGVRQLAYTARLGGGLSATVALEDKQMWGNDSPFTVINKADTANALVGNIRLDQAWGFAALHGVVGKHTYGAETSATPTGWLNSSATQALTATSDTVLSKTGWAVGSTVSFNLDMLAKGDKLWVTANYADGWIGALMSTGSLTSLSDSSSGGRVLGGAIRKDANLVFNGTSVDTTTGWNVGGQFLHYWAPQWRSVFTAGYIELTPPTQTAGAAAWGKGSIMETRGSIIWSPVRDLDIGLELQYLKNNNSVQNVGTAAATSVWNAAGTPGKNNSNITTKLRVERTF